MKFKVKEPDGFKHGLQHYEEGNSYASEKHGLSDDEVNMFHQAGWISVEGREEIDRDPYRVVSLGVQSVSHEVNNG